MGIDPVITRFKELCLQLKLQHVTLDRSPVEDFWTVCRIGA